MSRFPKVTDFPCTHPGCGARAGARCTYSGYANGHPSRRQRVMDTIDQRLRSATTVKRKLELMRYRDEFLASGKAAA